jgi:predicted hydrocarbon binding protein
LLLQGCAAAHYRSANMDAIVSQYTGNLAGFLAFLSEKWQWKVTYDQGTQTIIADENKPACVCPIVQMVPGKVSATLCHCSEGFAERMFSAVIEKPVEAKVVRSILRGDQSCVYSVQVL